MTRRPCSLVLCYEPPARRSPSHSCFNHYVASIAVNPLLILKDFLWRDCVFINHCTRLAFCCFNIKLPIHVGTAAMRGHTNHTPVTCVVCVNIINQASRRTFGISKFDSTFGLLTRIARALFEQLDEIPLAVSRFLCFILRSPF